MHHGTNNTGLLQRATANVRAAIGGWRAPTAASTSSAGSSDLSGHSLSWRHRLHSLWHYRYRFLFGSMTDVSRSPGLDAIEDGGVVGRSQLSQQLQQSPRSAWSWLPCFSFFQRFDPLVLANHLYCLISLSYLTLDSVRVAVFSPGSQSSSAMQGLDVTGEAAAAHARFVLFSDSCMLILAALFVVDACIYASVHAKNVRINTARIEKQQQQQKQREQAQQQLLLQPVSTTTTTMVRVEPVGLQQQLSPRSGFSFSSSSASANMHVDLASSFMSSSMTGGAFTPMSPSSPSPTAYRSYPPPTSASSSSSSEAKTQSPPSSSASLSSPPLNRRQSWRSLFLSLASSPSSLFSSSSFALDRGGVAELLNVVGAVGYLLTSLVPFVFFLVSAPTERVLDRAANLVDNVSMAIFVADSWLYMDLWRRKHTTTATKPTMIAKTSHSNDNSSNEIELEERQSLIGVSISAGAAEDKHSRLSSSSSSSRAHRHHQQQHRSRSICDSREWDLYWCANVCNILAGCFYLVSTLYGFMIRMRADEELDNLKAMAVAVAEAGAATVAAGEVGSAAGGGAVVTMSSATGLPFSGSLRHSRSSFFFQSSSRSSRADPLLTSAPQSLRATEGYLSWELRVEQDFHTQQVLGLVGDLFYFGCALCMELAYNKARAANRKRIKKYSSDQRHEQEQHEQRQQQQQQQQAEQESDDEDEEHDGSEHKAPQTPILPASSFLRHSPSPPVYPPLIEVVLPSSSRSSPSSSNNSNNNSSSANSSSFCAPIVVLDRNDRTIAMSPMSPPHSTTPHSTTSS